MALLPAASLVTCTLMVTLAEAPGLSVPRFQPIVPPLTTPPPLLAPTKLVPDGIASKICTFVAGPAPRLPTVRVKVMVSPIWAEVRSADLLSWSCGGCGEEITETPKLLLAIPLGSSELRTCAVLLIVPRAAAVDCTCTVKRTED